MKDKQKNDERTSQVSGFPAIEPYLELIYQTERNEKNNKKKFEKFAVDPSDHPCHEIGNKDCRVGWCGYERSPHKCECGGLIHVDFRDEFADCTIALWRKCDKCGDDWEMVE